jgi:hypothetical protein
VPVRRISTCKLGAISEWLLANKIPLTRENSNHCSVRLTRRVWMGLQVQTIFRQYW